MPNVLTTDTQDQAGVWLQRYTLHGDLILGPHMRVFAQLSSAIETGRAGGPSPVDENKLALQNAFIDLNIPLGQDAALTLRGGRQELLFGSGRLVDAREGPNVRRTFDAVRAIVELPEWRVDMLITQPRRPLPGVFDDEANKDQALWGIYAVGGKDWLAAGAVDLYYLGYRDNAGTFAQGTARERRHSIGARFHGAKRGWDWNWEAIYQFGSFGDGTISAWTIASETGFTFQDRPWRPRIALSANIASGDSDPTDANLGTFNPLFPRGNYFSEAAVLGPRNFFNIHPFLTVSPLKDWSLTADVNVFWRLDTNDGVYAPSGQLIRLPSGSDERFVGSAASLTSEYALSENLILTASYTHFFAGDFIRMTGTSEDIDFIELTIQFKF
ncbi:MAG: alginate export family protein [Sphingomonas sp.]|nr:MAG: alginate export family protein [Sphingomonas sp.]